MGLPRYIKENNMVVIPTIKEYKGGHLQIFDVSIMDKQSAEALIAEFFREYEMKKILEEEFKRAIGELQ